MDLFSRPFTRADVEALALTKQPFRDLNCRRNTYKQVTEIKERGGIWYVSIAHVFANGMKPETDMLLEDAVDYLNTAPRLEFLPVNFYL